MKDLKNIPFDKRIYLDETGIHQFLFRESGRSLCGKKVFGAVSGNRFIRQNIISALSKGQFLSPMCFEGTCNTGLFNIWLKEVLTPQLTPGSVLILDNAGFHKSAESRKTVESAGCKLMFLPPYSPDLNPIEKYWANMKNKVREILRKVTNFTFAIDQAILSM